MSGHETPIERAEEHIKEDVGEVEEAAWETVYEARDMVKDAVDKIVHPHHKHTEQDK